MTNEKMEQRLAAALEKTAPNDVSGVLSRCEERKGTVIPMTTKKTTKRRWTSLIAACLAVMLLGGGLFYQRVNAVASVVSLDVNPSIELKVNRSEKVLVCTPLNEDAKAILADMGNGADLKGAKLDVAVNAIVGSLVRNGYLNSISSAIMISVEDKDTARAEKLQRELTSTVDGVLQTSESRASVLTQTLTQDAVLEQRARENSISTGKAALVNRVLALNATLKFDALAKLSVEELKDLAEAGAPPCPSARMPPPTLRSSMPGQQRSTPSRRRSIPSLTNPPRTTKWSCKRHGASLNIWWTPILARCSAGRKIYWLPFPHRMIRRSLLIKSPRRPERCRISATPRRSPSP